MLNQGYEEREKGSSRARAQGQSDGEAGGAATTLSAVRPVVFPGVPGN